MLFSFISRPIAALALVFTLSVQVQADVDNNVVAKVNGIKIKYMDIVEAQKLLPEQYKKIAHHLLILHGRYVCKARNPLCENCTISTLCKYFKNLNYGKTQNIV